MAKYHHIVMFRLKEHVTPHEAEDAVRKLVKWGQGLQGLESWDIKLSIDTRKGPIIIENAVFTDEPSFEQFKLSKQHQESGQFMSTIADWYIGDYLL